MTVYEQHKVCLNETQTIEPPLTNEMSEQSL
jgi:hypothetical protein